MARLPQVGGDNGNWGDILNDYLNQVHNGDGTLKDDVVGSNQLQDNSVTHNIIAPGAVTKGDVGLSNANNTADTDKPVSTAQQAALNLKADTSALATKLNSSDLDAQTATNIATTASATQNALLANYSSASGSLALTRLERQTQNTLRSYGNRTAARIADATTITETWANTTAWTGTGTVASGRVYSSTGLTRAVPTSTRWVARTTLHATGTASKYAYFGVGSDSAAANLFGIGQGSASTTAAILRGTNISASNVIIPRPLPTLTVGDYLCTIAVDETYISLTIQTSPAGQAVYGARLARANMPSGALTTMFLSANDTTAGGLNWGPLIIYSELAIPPAAAWTAGGVSLFGTGNPLVMLRADATTGDGHMISIPGNIDSRLAAPMTLFLHQASTGTAMSPWTESRMANVTSALESGGYILLASDNGPATTAGGPQDKFGNQAGQDDYAAATLWARQHFNTGALVLYGSSQGSLFTQNILASRAIGGIAAVATVSGGSDLIIAEQDPVYQSALRNAYGATSSADFATKVVGYNPIAFSGQQFRGVPQRFYVGSTDTTSPPATQVTPFVNKLLPFVPEAQVVSLPVGHLDNSLYQGSDVVAFFSTYVV